MEQNVKWVRDADGSWHRALGSSGAPPAVNALCGMVVMQPTETSPEPPMDVDARCDECMKEGEAQPPNH